MKPKTVQLSLSVDQFKVLLLHTTSKPTQGDLEAVFAVMQDVVEDKCRRIEKRTAYSQNIKTDSP